MERVIQGAVSVINSREPLSGKQVDELRAMSEAILEDGQPMVVFDMSELPLVTSDGLECLMDLKDDFGKRGGNLKVAGPTPLVQDILRITNVDQHFEIFERVSQAVGSFVR